MVTPRIDFNQPPAEGATVHTTIREVHCKVTVLGWEGDACCTLRSVIDTKTLQQIDDITVDYVVGPSGQEVTPALMTYSEVKKLLSDIKSQIKPI